MSQHPGSVTIIGGGILGMAVALALREAMPALPLRILEKEAEVGLHQTGHNSGVIHAGLYYKPGSLKATMCAEGRVRMEAFCDAHGVRRERCGKLVIATRAAELPRLEALRERAVANGLAVQVLDPAAIRAREPHASGLRGLWVPETGIVDYREVAKAMRAELAARSVEVRTGHAVTGVRHESSRLVVETSAGQIATDFALNCAGLHSDRVARQFGIDPGVRIVPFRGEYFHLAPAAAAKVQGLIYPVPDPELPFLGVHLTRGIHGQVEAGPNAVLAFAREGYHRGNVAVRDLADLASFSGFWRMSARWWRVGIDEWRRSLSRARFVRDLQQLVPELRAGDLVPGGSGVRAQAVDRDGRLVDDFLFAEGPRSLHVLNAPSPGATASLAIGRHIAGRALDRMPD